MKRQHIILGSFLGLVLLAGGAFAMTAVNFSDVPDDHWVKPYLDLLVPAGVVGGYDDDTFRPNNEITRAESVALLGKYHNEVVVKEVARLEMEMADMESMMMEKMEDMMMEMKMEMEEDMMMEMEGTTLHLENVSEDQVLSPGLVVVHTDAASINFEGMMGPDALEPLAEVGDATDLKALLEGMMEEGDDVVAVYDIGAIAPGEMLEVMLDEMYDAEMPLYVSVIQMAVGSNDGYALIDGLMLKSGEMMEAVNHDAGTEENEDLLSGFEGGQPDPERTAEENRVNGMATEPKEEVSIHDQLLDTLLTAELM